MNVRARFSRGLLAVAVAAATAIVGVGFTASPAGAAAPVVDLWAPATINLTQQDGAQNSRTNHIYAMAIIRHDAGTSVNGVRFDLVHATSGGTYGSTNCATTQHITCSGGYKASGGWTHGGGQAFTMTTRELPGQASATTNTDSNYTQVWIDIKPRDGNSWQNDGPDGSNNGICGLEGGGPRLCKNTASFSFRLTDGQTTGENTMTYYTVGENDGSGEDFPAVFATNTVDQGTLTAGQANAVTFGYTCDDNDGGGGNDCDSARVRFRRLGDNATVNPQSGSDVSGNLVCSQAGGSEGCETRTNNGNYVNGNFNADDNNDRTYTYRSPRTRGLYLVEASFCNDDGLCPHGTVPTQAAPFNDTTTTYGLPGNMWQLLGSFYINESSPTVSFGSTTQTGGGTVAQHPTTGALHPNTGTTLTFNATTSADTQVIDWNTDQNNSNGINSSGYEARTYGTVSYSSSPGTPTVTKTRTLNLSGYGANTNCAAAVRVYDTGGINATDASSASATASRTCTTNKLPVGTAQSGVNVQRGTAPSVNVAASDADNWTNGVFAGAGGDEVPTISVTQPAVGTVTCGAFSASSASAGTFPCSYSVPSNTAPQAYTWSYTVTDSHAGTSASVSVTGNITNTAPTATGNTRTIQRGTSSVFNLAGTDPVNNDTLDGSIANTGYATVSTAGMPGGSTTNCTAAGACTVAIAAGTTPGNYSFTWNVKDNNATSTTATETITVANTAPVASAVTVNNVQRGRPEAESPFNLNATDAVNGDALTYSVVSTAGLPVGSTVDCTAGGACEVSVPSDTPLADYSFTYKANDNDLDSNTATVTVGVGNTTPVANDVGVFHTTVGNPVAIVLNGTDFNGDTLFFITPQTPPTKGTLSNGDENPIYTPLANTKGSDTFTYSVSDNGPSTSPHGTVTVEIDNTAPTADAQAVDAPRQVATPITLTGADVNDDDLTFAIDSNATKGVLDCEPSGSCTYTADAGETGTDSFTFVTNDGTANSAPATVTITITNQDPTADDQDLDAPRRVPTNFAVTGTDPNNDALTYAVDTQPGKGQVTCDSAGACTYTSDPGETGTDSFTFTAEDIEGATDTGTVTITLTNSDPTADDQDVDAPREVATAISLGGSDPNEDAITFSVDNEPTKGQVACAPDGACTYTSDPGETGTDSFTFTTDDGLGGVSAPATVTITLTNSDPTGAAATYNVTNGVPKSFVLAGTDPNNDSLTFSIDSYPSNGTLGCLANVCTYTASIASGTDSFTFVASDGLGGVSAPTTVTFNVGPPRVLLGDIKVLEPDSGTMGAFAPVTLSAPLNTDVTIGYYTENGTALEGSGNDYRYLGKPTAPAYVKIPAGKTWNATGGISVYGDAVTEADETFSIKIASVTTGNGTPVAVGDDGGTITIVDNYRPSSDPLMMISDAWLYESDTTTGATRAQFVLQFSKPVATAFTLNYQTLNGTAIGGTAANGTNDFKAISSGTLTIPAGWQGSKVIDVLIWGDTVTEDHETLQLQVVLPDGTPVVQRDPIGTVVLLNDD